MNYIKYNRSLVMMEEQSSQFAGKDSVPVKGYLKVETGNNKGAIRCFVQNLRFFEKGDYIYKLILFGKKGEKTIHTMIGNLIVNRQGNGETYFRFLPLDVDGKGNSYHNYSTAIVAAASTRDDKEPLHPVLKGVTVSEAEPFQSELTQVDNEFEENEDSEFGSIINKIDNLVEEVQEALQNETTASENATEDLVGAPAAAAEDLLRTPAAAPENLPETSAAAEDLPSTSAGTAIEESNNGKGTAAPKEDTISKKTYNDFYNEYILNSCAHTCRIAEFYEDVAPFDKDKTGARWKKIVNITNLPMVSPGAHYFATRYHHYIFGAKADEKGMAAKYFFGIPGRFLDEEQPDGGKSGFTYWQPIRGAEIELERYHKGEYVNRNVYGYWIVAVDAKTGSIEEV